MTSLCLSFRRFQSARRTLSLCVRELVFREVLFASSSLRRREEQHRIFQQSNMPGRPERVSGAGSRFRIPWMSDGREFGESLKGDDGGIRDGKEGARGRVANVGGLGEQIDGSWRDVAISRIERSVMLRVELWC